MTTSWHPPAPRPHRIWRLIGRILGGIVLLLVVIVLGAFWYASTSSFANLVRGKLIDVLTTATGGRVELARFSWHPLKLAVELDDLTIHGLESPQEVPYAHVDKLLVHAKIIDLFKADIGLRLLQAEHPVFHLIFYKDGTTNQPTPKKKTTSNKSVTDTIFDLQVDRTQVDNGLILVNQRAMPLDLAANNLAAKVSYLPANDHYLGTLHIEDLTAARGAVNGRPTPTVHSRLDLTAEMARNALQVKGLHFVSGNSHLEASAALADFTQLHWHVAANGAVDLREIAELASIDGLGPGEAVLQLNGQGTGATVFKLDGNLKLKDATYRSPTLLLSGLNVATSLHVTPDEISLPNLAARLRQGGGIDANIKLRHWLPPASPAASPAQAAAAPAAKAPPQQANIHARIFGLKLQTVLETLAAQRYPDFGFDTEADGVADIRWTGSIAGMVADARIDLSPPRPPTPNEVPVRGLLDVSYVNRGGRLDARQVEIHTPASSLTASGRASFSPATGPTSLKIDFTTTNLNEFNRALIALNLPSKKQKGVTALPVQLHGQAGFHGIVTGSLKAPDVKGHLSATNFATIIDTAATPATAHPPHTVPVSVTPPHPPPASAGTRQTIQWDDLEVDAEYAPALVSIHQATLRRGHTLIHASGQLHAHRLRHNRLAFDDESALTADATIHNATVTELLSIAGENLPVTGAVNLQAHVAGTLGNLSGGGHLTLLGGEIYGEPYKSLNTDLVFAGKEVGVSNFILAQNGGRLTGDGGYNLSAKSFHANVTGSGFELAHLQQLQRGKISIAGGLAFDLHATGTAKAPQVNGHLQLTNLVLGGQQAGGVQAEIHTTGNTLFLNANSDFIGARINLAGKVALAGNYQADAKLTFSRLDIDPLMKIANVQGINGHSAIAGTVTVSGPAKTPKLLSGDASIDQFSVTVRGMPVTTKGPIRATLRNGVLDLTQLDLTADDTNLEAHGAVDLFGDQGMDLAATGALNLKLAQSFSPDITSSGHVDLHLTATGALKKPDLEGKVVFTNVNFADQAIPNGISHLNGTLQLSGGRLEIQNMTGATGGGQVTLAGFFMYQNGLYGDLTVTLKDTRFRYAGLSASTDTKLRVQGTQTGILVSGNVVITRFLVGANVDFAALAGSGAVAPPPDPTAFTNKIRLDVHVTSAPQLDFQNSFAQLAGSVNLRIRGTVAQPSVLGRITVTDGQATFSGTTYQLQHGDIFFSNPVHIEPTIDLDATARIEEYDVTIGLHGNLNKLTPTFRSEPPLPEADVISLLAQGRTQEEQSIYSSEQQAAGTNGTTNALLSGALNATVSNRVSKLFGVGSVKIDPTYVGSLGNSSARITVQENIGQSVQLTYATNINTTSAQLIQAQFNLSPTLSLTAVRDESDVFSLLFKIHRRYR